MLKVQICCISIAIISMIVMGTHLFIGDGISNPSPVLEITAVLALAGLTGNAIAAFIRLSKERNEQHRH